MEKIEIEVYNFEELEESVQRKLLERYIDINTDYDWFESFYYDFKEQLSEIGIECTTFYWSLDRNRHIYMHKPYINDLRKFLKYCEMDLRTKEAKYYIENGLSIETNHYQCSARNYINSYPYETDVDFTDILNDYLNNFLIALEKEYEYLTSDEAIIETFEANEYKFTKEGRVF